MSLRKKSEAARRIGRAAQTAAECHQDNQEPSTYINITFWRGDGVRRFLKRNFYPHAAKGQRKAGEPASVLRLN